MKLKEVRKVLEKLGQSVVTRSRYNLTRSGVKKGNLWNSIKVLPIASTETGLRLTWEFADYAMFIDAGVFGSAPSRADTFERKYDPDAEYYDKRQQKWRKGKVVKDFSKPKYKGVQKGKWNDSVFTTGAGKIADKFQYKGLRPPMSALREYVKENKIRFRNPKGTSEGGQYRQGDYDTIAFWLQNRIWAQGITPTLFFTKAFRSAWKKMPEEVFKAFDFEITTMINEKNLPITKA